MGFIDGVVATEEHLDDFVVVIVGGEDERGDVRRKLTLFISSEKRIFTRFLGQFGACNVVGMFDDYPDSLGGRLTDGVEESFLDAFKVDLVQQQLNRLHALTVHSQVEGTPSHVVEAVDVQAGWPALLAGVGDGDVVVVVFVFGVVVVDSVAVVVVVETDSVLVGVVLRVDDVCSCCFIMVL